MQEITPETVRHVALLSRLELTEEEVSVFVSDLNSILGYVDKLSELDTKDIPPTSHSLKLQNVFREDDVQPSLSNEDALSNAPDCENGYFKVPAVLQDSGGA
jgi:aspartyl-tRNA(Asn)/glutamyl-tRNA(Gln) amidotransferase subunit C